MKCGCGVEQSGRRRARERDVAGERKRRRWEVQKPSRSGAWGVGRNQHRGDGKTGFFKIKTVNSRWPGCALLVEI